MELFFNNFVDLSLDVAPWLIIGLIATGLVKAWIPESAVARWLGGRGLGPITRGALIGAPLPLCSCSVVPMAMGLHRKGASKPATVSFLVATPETGVDSVAISWVLLGPFLTIVRPIAAIFSAVTSGLSVLLIDRITKPQEKPRDQGNSVSQENSAPVPNPMVSGASSQKFNQIAVSSPITQSSPTEGSGSCCSSSCCGSTPQSEGKIQDLPHWRRLQQGMKYAMTDIWDDLAPWLAIGVLITALVMTWVPPGKLTAFSEYPFLAMLTMIAASVPVYVCASASTPIAAAMIFSGLTPGMALAFMIAGPATNIATLGIIKRELGGKTLTAYLIGIVFSAIFMGLGIDWITHIVDSEIVVTRPGGTEEILPFWLSMGALIFLASLSLRHPVTKMVK
ncbi:SO_0444 family Cu/Zn efflux transporter [Magnetococcus sp. PR-3]|uniref:SO_0444 family Cu/Zn efflux transporter n=1 Tax=Magnetococcus sp. PR-3 TaxID=3120355 RepID=UPI002FCDF47F